LGVIRGLALLRTDLVSRARDGGDENITSETDSD
jgi:hypothetical protein